MFGHTREDKDGNTEIYGGGAGPACEVVFRIHRVDDEILQVLIWADDRHFVRILSSKKIEFEPTRIGESSVRPWFQIIAAKSQERSQHCHRHPR
jgi:hypothetical protein